MVGDCGTGSDPDVEAAGRVAVGWCVLEDQVEVSKRDGLLGYHMGDVHAIKHVVDEIVCARMHEDGRHATELRRP